MERVLDDAADELRREEVGEFRGERRGDGVEVDALVSLEAAGGPDFSYVRNVRPRGESSGAEQLRFAKRPRLPRARSLVASLCRVTL